MSTFPDRIPNVDSNAAADINLLAQGLPEYRSSRTYIKNTFIWHGDPAIIYRSLVASNQGNTPASSPTKWEVFSSGGGGITSIDRTIYGVTLVGTSQIALMVSTAFTVDTVFVKVDNAPTDADMQIDIHKNGTTIFTTQSKRPIIPASSTSDTSETPDETAFAQNDILTIDIDQVGSTINGGDNLYIRINFV